MPNHCPAKLSTSADDRGSASSRSTCACNPCGMSSSFVPAAASSWSSGMLLQIVYERREASSYPSRA